MKKMFCLFLVFTFSFIAVQSQSLEEDKTIVYMKANVLFDSGRFDESIRLYNRVINKDKNYSPAYFMRAKAKYMLGAYKGTKNDALQFIELAGVNKSIIKLMSKTEIKLENYPAAKNYLLTSLELDPFDAEQHKLLGDVYMALRYKNEACEQWTSAAKLGNNMAMEFLKEYCEYQLDETWEEEQNEYDTITQNSEIATKESPSNDDGIDRKAVNKIEVDEYLVLVFGNGLGTRTIDQVPEIFMISDKAGQVVIDVCVDGSGKVVNAEYNQNKSNIRKAGLTSLALRKAKEVQFFPSFRQEQCGHIIFDIKS